jgi:hypothetical protein
MRVRCAVSWTQSLRRSRRHVSGMSIVRVCAWENVRDRDAFMCAVCRRCCVLDCAQCGSTLLGSLSACTQCNDSFWPNDWFVVGCAQSEVIGVLQGDVVSVDDDGDATPDAMRGCALNTDTTGTQRRCVNAARHSRDVRRCFVRTVSLARVDADAMPVLRQRVRPYAPCWLADILSRATLCADRARVQVSHRHHRRTLTRTTSATTRFGCRCALAMTWHRAHCAGEANDVV